MYVAPSLGGRAQWLSHPGDFREGGTEAGSTEPAARHGRSLWEKIGFRRTRGANGVGFRVGMKRRVIRFYWENRM